MNVLSFIATLVQALAWPVAVISLVLIFRTELGERLAHLKSLRTPATEMEFELSTRIDALEGSVETQQLGADVLATTVQPASAQDGVESIPQALLDLRKSYLDVNEPDHERRIQVKNNLARSMGAEVLRVNINRQTLAGQGDEILTLSLAAVITALPQSGDDDLILMAGVGIQRLHVRYRLAAAVSALAQSGVLQPKLVPEMEGLMQSYRRYADTKLSRRIDWTMKVLAKYGKDSSNG